MSRGTRVCAIADLPADAPQRVEVEGRAVCLVRTASGLHAIDDRCSHADVSLSEGEVDDDTIECWLHGSAFDLRTGEPTSLPAITPVPVYTVTTEGDDVYVALVPPLKEF